MVTYRCTMADQQQQQRCTICGSRFAERKCYFCESRVCTSCTVPTDVSGYTTKCITCYRRKIDRLGFTTLLRRNYYLIGIIVAFWLFTVFPLPFMAACRHRRRSERIPACHDSDGGHDHSFYIHVSGLAKKGT